LFFFEVFLWSRCAWIKQGQYLVPGLYGGMLDKRGQAAGMSWFLWALILIAFFSVCRNEIIFC